MSQIKIEELFQVFHRPVLTKKSSEQYFIALSDINLQIDKGSTTVIIGMSGAGKTTLFDILSTQLEPSTGKLSIEGIQPISLDDEELLEFRWNTIGYMHQLLAKNFMKRFTFRQHLDLLKDKGSIIKPNNEKILSYLKKLGLKPQHLDLKISKMSGGEQQRISLLLLMLRDPEIYLLDEPTSFLDSTNRSLVLQLLKTLKANNKTLILATHDPELLALADSTYYMDNGRLHTEKVIEKVSATLADLTFQVEGSPPTLDFLLTIPPQVYQHLKHTQIYVIQYLLQKSQNLSFRNLDNQSFETKLIKNWIYLDSNSFTIPLKFQNQNWFSKKILWVFTEDGIQISFQDD